MESMHLEHAIIDSEEIAVALAACLTRRSQWFTFEPLPDDQYEFQFKAENLESVRAFIKEPEFMYTVPRVAACIKACEGVSTDDLQATRFADVLAAFSDQG